MTEPPSIDDIVRFYQYSDSGLKMIYTGQIIAIYEYPHTYLVKTNGGHFVKHMSILEAVPDTEAMIYKLEAQVRNAES